MQEKNSQFSRFQIQRSLRHDLWGEVLLAFDPEMDRRVNIHVLARQLAENQDIRERYLQVTRTILRWRQRGIARILDFGQTASQVFTVQEFNPGRELALALDELQAAGCWISLAEAVNLTSEIGQSLAYAHQRSLAHGNLTAENILLGAEPGAQLGYQPLLLNTGLGLPGTILALSDPLHIQESIAGDITAAGKLLGWLVCGQRDVSNLRNQRPDLPGSLERVIQRAGSANPAERFETIEAFIQALSTTLPTAQRITTPPAGFAAVGMLQAVAASSPVQAAPPVRSAPLGKSNPPEDNLQPEKQAPLELVSASAPADEAAQDVLHITLPDGGEQKITIRSKTMIFGRDPDNDIILDLQGISRHHARLEYNGKDYFVTDLQSTNGTFMGELRLLPETPQIWLPGESLRLGDIRLSFERSGAAVEAPAAPEVEKETIAKPVAKIFRQPAPEPILQPAPEPPEETLSETTQVKFSPGNGPVGAYSIETNLMVTPGKSITVPILLYNRSTRDDIFYLEVQGIPVEWMPNRLESASLPASGQREVKLVIRPPRTPASRAGRHSILLRVISQNDPRHSVELRLALTIAAFSQIASEIQPRQLQPGIAGNLVLRNMGNIPETFTLSWDDRNHELRFEPRRANAIVPPGETVQVGFQVSRQQPIWFGSEKVNSFSVNVAPISGQAQTHSGSLLSQALIPRWALISLVTLCLVLSCVMVIFANQLLGTSPDARATAQASQTIAAILEQGTPLSLTATSAAMLGGNPATQQAATATEAWKALDSDADGLTNAQEILLLTRPDNPDSDADGLKDGEEVNTYRTYPLTPDSDGDGLKDGDEVLKRTNPLNRDTDGDGIDDLLDPDPMSKATATLPTTPTATATGTATPTATVTPTLTPPPNIANLAISLTNNTTTAIPGTNTAYTIQVQNTSPIPVNNIQVIDAFPAILLNPTWNCVASPGSVCQAGNGLGNIDTRLNLAPGGMANFTISASINPTASGLLINSTSVKLPDGISDPDPSNNQAMDTDNLVPTVNLDITLTDNRSSAEPGDTLTYTINATNHGPSAVFGLVITDFFPDALSNVTWVCSVTPGSSCGVSGVKTGNINTDVNLAPGGVATFTANATVNNNASGILTNSAGLISPLSPSTNNKTANDTTTIIPKADLGVTVSAPATAAPSLQVTYTITVTNMGPSNASGLTLVDDLAIGVTFLSSDPGLPVCSLLGNSLTCNLGDLAAGEKKVIRLVIQTPVLPGVITNLVNVSASQADPVLVNNQATTDILIQ